MNALFDIFSVLRDHWQLIGILILLMLISQMLIRSALRLAFGDWLTAEDSFALSAAGWMLPLSLASIVWLAAGALVPARTGALLLALLVVLLAFVLFLRARHVPVPRSIPLLWILVVLFGASILLRFAFVYKVILPLYFDSAQHYQITSNLLRVLASSESPLFSPPTGMYYHVGFHFLSAWMVSLTGADIIYVILILGQVIVAVTPFALFPLLREETQSSAGALFGVLLAAFGWYMPAYAVNWGKYPALTSLPLITFVMSLAYLSLRYRDALSRRQSLGLNIILALGVFITVLFHTRTLIVLGILVIAWVLANLWQRLPALPRSVIFVVILLGTAATVMYIRTKDIFGLLFDPYWEKGAWVTVVVLILGIFAQWRTPRLAVASLLVILLLFGTLLIPLSVPGYGDQTLLDRPFVEMILYLPLSVLGGAGLAGLEKSIQALRLRSQAGRFPPASYFSSLFIVLLLVNALLSYNIYPADCCSIVGRDDLVAIDWMEKNLPPEARIAISSTDLYVLDSEVPQGAAGGDAGIWITPLTDRVTMALPYQSDFSQQAIFDKLCQWGAGYLYVGEVGASFNDGLIRAQPDRYQILLSMPKSKVYQVTGCPLSP